MGWREPGGHTGGHFVTATESWLSTVYRMEGRGRECSETGVQQQKLKQNWLVVSKPSVTGDGHHPLLVGCKVTVTLLVVCSRTTSASGR